MKNNDLETYVYLPIQFDDIKNNMKPVKMLGNKLIYDLGDYQPEIVVELDSVDSLLIVDIDITFMRVFNNDKSEVSDYTLKEYFRNRLQRDIVEVSL